MLDGWFGTIIGALFAGIIIGPLARLVMPGKQDIGIPATIGAGAVGALAGGLVAQALGVADTRGVDWIELALQIGAAALAVVALLSMKKSSA